MQDQNFESFPEVSSLKPRTPQYLPYKTPTERQSFDDRYSYICYLHLYVVFIVASNMHRHNILLILSKRIYRTAHAGRPTVEDMGVNHRGLHVFMP
jgi:hypothetical protein